MLEVQLIDVAVHEIPENLRQLRVKQFVTCHGGCDWDWGLTPSGKFPTITAYDILSGNSGTAWRVWNFVIACKLVGFGTGCFKVWIVMVSLLWI